MEYGPWLLKKGREYLRLREKQVVCRGAGGSAAVCWNPVLPMRLILLYGRVGSPFISLANGENWISGKAVPFTLLGKSTHIFIKARSHPCPSAFIQSSRLCLHEDFQALGERKISLFSTTEYTELLNIRFLSIMSPSDIFPQPPASLAQCT